MKEKIIKILVLVAIILISGYFRTYNIRFGLPHSFYADEPEIVELAIKYTYEFRDIVSNNNVYKLIPISYVYGTAPTYFFTFAVMGFSKFNNLLGLEFDKTSLYLVSRYTMALLSIFIPIVAAFIYKKVYKDNFGTFLTLGFLALNWKLISHAHYVNADLFQTVFLTLSFATSLMYLKSEKDTKFTVLTGIFYGIALGSKITTAITLPLYLYLFLSRKELRNAVGFGFVVLGTYIVTNPFSFIFINDFLFRILEMRTKEAGMVFDSVDSNPLKYVFGLSFIVTFPVLIISIYGLIKSLKEKTKYQNFHIFLLGHILFYLLFFSLQSRRVDRWLLPLIPVMVIYFSYGFVLLKKGIKKFKSYLLISLISVYYLYFAFILLFQFRPDTPKSAAYLWMRDNIPIESWKLVYTQEGLDPMNKLNFADVYKYNVYSSEGAQFFLPQDPFMYDYVVLSSRSMENFKRPEVRKAYPFYAEKWDSFENTVLDSSKFELIKEFTLPKPNLIPLSDVYIYKNLEPATRPAPVLQK